MLGAPHIFCKTAVDWVEPGCSIFLTQKQPTVQMEQVLLRVDNISTTFPSIFSQSGKVSYLRNKTTQTTFLILVSKT